MILAASLLAAGTVHYLLSTSQRRRLIISTTTSLYDTGILEEIEKAFEERYPIDLYFISVGTGLAIQHAKRGDADLVLVHAPSTELTFLREGYGVNRKIFAYNFFVIVGPADDPAGIKGLEVTEALMRVVEAGRLGHARWVSRGDDSGTHVKEIMLWSLAGFNWTTLREESWFMESGTGMGKTLLLSNEREAYTLSDIGTYLKYSSKGLIELQILVDEAEELINVYSAIAVNPKAVRGVNFEDAVTFIKFLISEECQNLIQEYKRDIYGKSLFHPAVRLLKENTDPTVAKWIRDYAYFNGTECPQQYRYKHPELYQ
jgi:tungstate transport system substrate-binding protein